jgi:hypothetical protein
MGTRPQGPEGNGYHIQSGAVTRGGSPSVAAVWLPELIESILGLRVSVRVLRSYLLERA